MSRDDALAVVARGHDGKIGYGRAADAERHARDGTRPYRCHYPDCHAWHLGNPLSIRGMARLAEAIRVLSGNGPGGA